MTKLLADLPIDDVKDIARAFLAALHYMVDHNGLSDELDDSSDVLES